MSCSIIKSQTFAATLIAAGLTRNCHELSMFFLRAASYFHSKLTFSLVPGDNAGKNFVVEEFKISQILKQYKLLARAWNHVKALRKFFKQLSCSERCGKSECLSISFDYSRLKVRY